MDFFDNSTIGMRIVESASIQFSEGNLVILEKEKDSPGTAGMGLYRPNLRLVLILIGSTNIPDADQSLVEDAVSIFLSVIQLHWGR